MFPSSFFYSSVILAHALTAVATAAQAYIYGSCVFLHSIILVQ